MGVLSECMHTTFCPMYALDPMELQSNGTTVRDNSELPCGCWELNSGPLEEQPVLLTAKPPLQTHISPILK